MVIDLFYAVDMHSFQGIINIKRKTYTPVHFPIYFILVGNNSISQDEIDALIAKRKIPLQGNIKVLTEKLFKDNFESFISIKEIS